LEYAAETSPPTADMRQKKKGKRMKKDLSKKTTIDTYEPDGSFLMQANVTMLLTT